MAVRCSDSAAGPHHLSDDRPVVFGRTRLPLRAVLWSVVLLMTAVVSGTADAEDWPWFLGPRHTGVSGETSLTIDWSRARPAVLWKQPIGTGYSAPSVLGNRVVVHHRRGRDEVISCRSVTDGQEQWQYRYASTFTDPYGYNDGPRCSPVLADGKCFTLGAEGMLTCVALEDGRLIWQHDLKNMFQIPDWFFGMGCSPVVDGDRLIVLVGGQPNSGVVAFDRNNGKVLWEAGGRSTWDGTINADTGQPYRWTGSEMVVSYSSPIPAVIHGRRHLLCLLRHGLLSLDPETGQEQFHYWFRARVHESVNAARPLVVGSRILLSAAYRTGSVLLEVAADGRSCSEVWRDRRNLLAHWTTPIHVDGYVYGFSGRHENEGELRCIRLEDGKVMWKTSGFDGDIRRFARDRKTRQIVDVRTGRPVPYPYYGRGSLTQVGSRFIVLGERGTLAAVDVNPHAFSEHGRFSLPEIHYPAWTAPVISSGKLYLRSEDWLVCLDLKNLVPPDEAAASDPE